jgi:hypothetical protein
MKTISKTIYEKRYTSTSKWGQPMESYVRIQRHFDLIRGLRYSVAVPNFGCCKPRLRDALLCALEHESILAAKYNGLKEQVSDKKAWGMFKA